MDILVTIINELPDAVRIPLWQDIIDLGLGRVVAFGLKAFGFRIFEDGSIAELP